MKIILTEQFDEGLMVLRRLMGWEMIDMSYCAMLKTKEGASRYDGKPLVNVPHFEDLPLEVIRATLKAHIWLYFCIFSSTKMPTKTPRLVYATVLVRHLEGSLLKRAALEIPYVPSKCSTAILFWWLWSLALPSDDHHLACYHSFILSLCSNSVKNRCGPEKSCWEIRRLLLYGIDA